MPDYQQLYTLLFNSVTDAVALLQAARRQAEDLYVGSGEPLEFPDTQKPPRREP